MTYNVFSGTLNPTHFTSLIRARTFHTELYFTTNVVANTHIYTFTYDN